MRILFLTQFWQPEQFFKGLPFVRDFTDKGYDVQVLTGFPHYPTGKILAPYRLRFFQREIMDGIKVNRVLLYPSHDQSTVKRIATYLAFMVSTTLLGPFLARKADIVYVYNLITLWPLAAFMRWAYEAKIVYDLQDLWPESILSSGMMKTSRPLRWMDKLCKRIYYRAYKIAVQSPGFKKYLEDRGVPAEKIEVIYNWTDKRHFPPRDPEKPGAEVKRPLRILYAGALGPVQGLKSIVECAAICRERKLSISFRLVGYGTRAEELRRLIREKELANCEVLPGRPLKDMGELFAWVDVFLVHIKDESLFRITIPSKVQALLFLGKPVLLAMNGDAPTKLKTPGPDMSALRTIPLKWRGLRNDSHGCPRTNAGPWEKNGRTYYEKNMGQPRESELPPKNWTAGISAFLPAFLKKEAWYNAGHETSPRRDGEGQCGFGSDQGGKDNRSDCGRIWDPS